MNKMNPWINYHHLFYFKTVVEEGGVTNAAAKLKIGQPTLSAQLKIFEDTLGLSLFERQHKKLIITEHGQIAFEYAKNIFQMGSEMYEVLHDRIEHKKMSVCIGALDSIPKQVVLNVVTWLAKIGHCQISLVEGRPDELIRELSAHRVDVLLIDYIPAVLGAKGLFHRIISKSQVSLYAAPKFKALRKNFPQSVSGQSVIVPTYDSRLRYDFEHWQKSHNIKLDVFVESQDIAVKELLAVSGMGLIPAAIHSIQGPINRGELVEIGKLLGIKESLVMVTAGRKIENPLAQKMMATFKL